MKIKGYKAFAMDGTNVKGIIFPPGRYHCDGNISFGTHGNGYHFAKRLEDTIRFGIVDDKLVGNVLIAEVIGSGTIAEGTDEYYGYYDMYSASDLEVIRYLSREEIIQYALSLHDSKRMERFVSKYYLTEEEQQLFYGIYEEVDLAIDYYQRNKKNVYTPEKKYQYFLRYQKKK